MVESLVEKKKLYCSRKNNNKKPKTTIVVKLTLLLQEAEVDSAGLIKHVLVLHPREARSFLAVL